MLVTAEKTILSENICPRWLSWSVAELLAPKFICFLLSHSLSLTSLWKSLLAPDTALGPELPTRPGSAFLWDTRPSFRSPDLFWESLSHCRDHVSCPNSFPGERAQPPASGRRAEQGRGTEEPSTGGRLGSGETRWLRGLRGRDGTLGVP